MRLRGVARPRRAGAGARLAGFLDGAGIVVRRVAPGRRGGQSSDMPRERSQVRKPKRSGTESCRALFSLQRQPSGRGPWTSG